MSDEYMLDDDEPCYVISVAAKLVSLHPQTLRYYDRIGLISPSRTSGRIRLYSKRNIESLRKITRLTEDLGVNLAGVEVIINMTKQMEALQRKLDRVRREAEAEISALQQRVRELEAQAGTQTQGGHVTRIVPQSRQAPPRGRRERD